MKKLYCYVDETGQDTKGEIFIVSVIIAQKDREEINKFLEKTEKETHKGKTKWVKTKKEFKISYLKKILDSSKFKNKIFYSFYQNTSAYKEITLLTVASAINFIKKESLYKASIFIDGLSKADVFRVGVGLRRIGVRTEKIRGVKDENEALVRLADAVAGLIREGREKQDYAVRLTELGLKQKTLIAALEEGAA